MEVNKSSRVPVWSFLAVEPAVKAAVKCVPDAFRDFVDATTSGNRADAFWRLFGAIERHVAQRNPFHVVDRHRLAVQSFYALIDLTVLSDARDRDVQRWLNSILKAFAAPSAPVRAVVAATSPVSIA